MMHYLHRNLRENCIQPSSSTKNYVSIRRVGLSQDTRKNKNGNTNKSSIPVGAWNPFLKGQRPFAHFGAHMLFTFLENRLH